MTDFEKTYQNYNPRAAALAEARALLTEAAKAAMADGTLAEAELPAFIVEIPADTKNGDIASNLAMAGARTWRKAPKMIADALLTHLPSIEHSVFAKVEVAGPGFINLFLAPSFWASVVLGACSNKEYGSSSAARKPIPCPLSAIRAATSRCWPVSLLRSTATSTLQPALGWTKRPSLPAKPLRP